jgi:signal transduction histidine kinase/ActR/RegA family two-component response regulator
MDEKNAVKDGLSGIIQILEGSRPIGECIMDALKCVGNLYIADRVYIFEIYEESRSGRNTFEWCREGIASQKAELDGIEINRLSEWMPAFNKHELVIHTDSDKMHYSQSGGFEAFKMRGVKRYIEAPLIIRGEFAGFIGVDNPDEEKLMNFGYLMIPIAHSFSYAVKNSQYEQKLIGTKRRYELAVEGAELGVWEYYVREHEIRNIGHRFTRYTKEKIIKSMPEALLHKVIKEDRDKYLDMYHRIEEGETLVSADLWIKWYADAIPVCEHVVYSVLKDISGKPEIAYGISMNVTGERQEQAAFYRNMHELLSENPDALGMLRANVTDNVCIKERGAKSLFIDEEQPDTLDGIIEAVAGRIPSEKDRKEFLKKFNSQNLIDEFENGKKNIQFEYRRTGKNGCGLWIKTVMNMLRNPETGDIEGVIYSMDVTREHENKDVLRILTGREYDFIAILHLDTGIVEAVHLGTTLPKPYLAIYSGPGSSCNFNVMRNHGASTWVDECDKKKYLDGTTLETIVKKLNDNSSYELVIQGRDRGGRIMFRKLEHYFLNEGHDSIIIIDSDVTKSYLAQIRELEKTKAEADRIQDIIDFISSGICVLRMPDENNLFIEYSNKQMGRMLGFDIDKVSVEDVRKHGRGRLNYFNDAFAGLYADDVERVRAIYRKGYYLKSFTVPNFRLYTAKGNYIWVSVDVVLREERAGEKIFYGTYRNVTDEIRLQNELTHQLKAEKELREQATAASAAKTDFVSRISHDIRTPINAITGMTAFAREDINDGDKLVSDLNKIEDSTRHLLSLINDVLDISKAESGKIDLNPEPYPYDDYIKSICDMFEPMCAENGLKFIIEKSDAVPGIIVDRVRFDQIAINILSNAVKYTPDGGQVRYVSKSRILDTGMVDCRFTVTDTGIGMSKEFQQTMFEPFTQEHDNPARNRMTAGTGLGLSIVKRIVDLMNGSVQVTSDVGKGTSITVRMMLNAMTDEQVEKYRQRQKSVNRWKIDKLSGRVLLVDDNDLNIEIAQRNLESFGFEVTCAKNGKEAVEEFSASAVNEFDAVLMDIQMPIMDGYAAAQAIRVMERDDAGKVPIIAMTADVFKEAVERCKRCGMNGHIGKPVNPDVLYDMLSNYVHH